MEKGRGLHNLIFLLLQRSPVPICSMLASDQKRKQENHLNKSALPKQDKKLIKEIPTTTTKRTKEKKKKVKFSFVALLPQVTRRILRLEVFLNLKS